MMTPAPRFMLSFEPQVCSAEEKLNPAIRSIPAGVRKLISGVRVVFSAIHPSVYAHPVLSSGEKEVISTISSLSSAVGLVVSVGGVVSSADRNAKNSVFLTCASKTAVFLCYASNHRS